MNKQKAIELWNEYNTYVLDTASNEFITIQKEWDNKVLELCLNLCGKRKTKPDLAHKLLVKSGYNGLLNEEIKPYQQKICDLFKQFNNKKDEIKKRLEEFASNYVPEKQNESIKIKSATGLYYYTEGLSANTYAKNSLRDDLVLLQILGFNAEIIQGEMFKSNNLNHQVYISYELWCNISKFDYDMLKLSNEFISVLNWAVLCWRNGTNPKVYFRSLSDDDYEKSLALWRKGYQITKDNMKLELSWEEINKL